MALSYELMSQFAKLVTKNNKTDSESTVYGTIIEDGDGNKYVKLDGSDQLTPLADENRPTVDSTTANANAGDRVTVLIKNHTATVTGNVSSPAATTKEVDTVNTKVDHYNKVFAQNLNAVNAHINELEADKVSTADLDAAKAEIEDLVAGKASIDQLEATNASIKELDTKKLNVDVADIRFATIVDLTAANANIDNLSAEYAEFKNATIDNLKAKDAEIDELVAEKASISELEAANAEIDSLKAKDAEIGNLVAGKADIGELEAINATIKNLNSTYANIDFANIGEAAIKKIFAESGIIRELAVGEQYITGELVGVTIKGDLIEGNTIKADKLVVKGEDGLYYALNYSGGALTGDKISDAIYYAVTYDEESGNYIPGEDPIDALQGTLVEGVVTTDNREVYSLTNTSGETIYYCLDTEWSKEKLHGSVIAAKSITATKIRVKDLAAFDATIGGFKITEDAIYSGVKESVDNSTTGVYMDNEGQIAIGDADNYIKYYKDNESYKLDIAAESINVQIKDSTQSFSEVAESISKHFTFNDDGLTISSGKNQMSIRIDNDIIIFEKNGEEFGWWDGVNFNTGNVMVNLNERAQFGNFAFVPRSDGSMSFLKVANNHGVYAMMSPSRIMTLYGLSPTLDENTLLISEGYGELDGTTLIVGGE